ncbi:MAG: hypothetical protein MUE61_17345, partial [Vicinamibacterales bacterium]|nr:hypothetical protein [Vicinamibacterales bacterium]
MRVNIPRALLVFVLLAAAGSWRLTTSAQGVTEAERQLQKAILLETVDGNLQAAIDQYKKIVAEKGSSRVVAAKALLRLAGCYEKLGQAEAEKTYRQLIADYADQTAEVALARQKLAALTRALATESGIVARQVWSGPDVDFSGRPSPDGRHLSYSHPTGNLAIRELATGEMRQLTKDASLWTAEGGALVSLFSPDGRQVVYEWGQWDTLLRLSSVDGSHTRVLLPAKRDWWPEPCDWSSDGRSILIHLYPAGGQEPSQIAVIAVADGSLRVVKRLDPGQRSWNMWFSPDGQYIV